MTEDDGLERENSLQYRISGAPKVKGNFFKVKKELMETVTNITNTVYRERIPVHSLGMYGASFKRLMERCRADIETKVPGEDE